MSGRSPSRQRNGGAALLGNAVLMVLVGLVIAVGASVLLARIQYGFWPWHTPASARRSGTYYTDAAKIALTVAGGIGGAVALVVSYRRQRLLERDEKGLHDRYGAAAAQLGDENPTIRLAGVYALANLADEWEPRRQQCVDVLCAYLRLPWEPETPAKHPLANRSITETTGDVATTYTFPPSLGEQEVRETILRVIAAHLQWPGRRWWQPFQSIDAPWGRITLDFTGAHLPTVEFRGCEMKAEVRFTDATFHGRFSFISATFHERVSFTGATFTQTAWFNSTIFHSEASFLETQFKGDVLIWATRFLQETDFGFAHFYRDAELLLTAFKMEPTFRGTHFDQSVRYSPSTFSEGQQPFDGAIFEQPDQPQPLSPAPEVQDS